MSSAWSRLLGRVREREEKRERNGMCGLVRFLLYMCIEVAVVKTLLVECLNGSKVFI